MHRPCPCILITTAGLAWPGLGWPGLGWPGLGWPGLGWPGLGWAGLAQPGADNVVHQSFVRLWLVMLVVPASYRIVNMWGLVARLCGTGA